MLYTINIESLAICQIFPTFILNISSQLAGIRIVAANISVQKNMRFKREKRGKTEIEPHVPNITNIESLDIRHILSIFISFRFHKGHQHCSGMCLQKYMGLNQNTQEIQSVSRVKQHKRHRVSCYPLNMSAL